MRFRDKMALNVSPLVLRVALGVVFIWAGSSKLLHNDSFTGERAARLANLGIVKPAPAPTTQPTVVPDDAAPETAPPAKPATPIVEPAPSATPTTSEPAESTPVEPKKDEPSTTEPSTERVEPMPAANVDVVYRTIAYRVHRTAMSEPSKKPKNTEEATEKPADAKDAEKSTTPKIVIGAAPVQYTAADFERPVQLRRLYNLVLLLDNASRPNDQGRVLWPSALASSKWLERAAWAAALTEFVGGILLLLGLLTRFSAIGILGTMLTAMWLTQIGPALGTPGAVLGFLPDPVMADPARWNALSSGWHTLLWQGTLACIAVTLILGGGGRMSMDGLIFRRGNDGPDDERKLARRRAVVPPPPNRPV